MIKMTERIRRIDQRTGWCHQELLDTHPPGIVQDNLVRDALTAGHRKG